MLYTEQAMAPGSNQVNGLKTKGMLHQERQAACFWIVFMFLPDGSNRLTTKEKHRQGGIWGNHVSQGRGH